MKILGIIPNTYKDKDFALTKKIILWLQDRKIKVLTSRLVAEHMGMSDIGINIIDLYKEVEALVVLGGDGTVLRVAKYAALYNVPIYGINIGTMGYLTDVEIHNSFEGLEKLLYNSYTIERRMMIEAFTLSQDTENDNFIALNDICVTRNYFGGIIELKLYINNKYIDNYRADGLIISTPTGSTAYNLSAGGPILMPDSKMVAITPICPHMLHSRSLVVSSDDKISVKIANKRDNNVIFSIDGQHPIPLKENDTIDIKHSSFYTSIIRTSNYGFYDVLRNKMAFDSGVISSENKEAIKNIGDN